MGIHTDHNKEKPSAPHSGLGMISLVIAAISFLLFATSIFLPLFGSLKHSDAARIRLLILPWLALSAMGVLVGVAARLQKGTNRTFASVGVIGNIVLIAAIIIIVAQLYAPCR